MVKLAWLKARSYFSTGTRHIVILYAHYCGGIKFKYGWYVMNDSVFTSYFTVSGFRARGAIEAARYGAVAVVVRSLTPVSLSTPHTGSMKPYPDDVTHIPAICCTTEDAEVMARLTRTGCVLKIHMTLGAHMLPAVPSRNIICEVKGRERPDEIVLVGAHMVSVLRLYSSFNPV